MYKKEQEDKKNMEKRLGKSFNSHVKIELIK